MHFKFLSEKKEISSIPNNLSYKKPEKYISHLEDAIIDHGHEGVNLSANYLDDAHKLLTGHKAKNEYQIKYDSDTSIIFGIHPETQQFFIESKLTPHDKKPKENHNKEDIEKNYKSKPELKQKLIIALYHLPKILPKDIQPGESYGADILHIHKDIKTKKGYVHFKPNSIMYSAPSDSSHGATAKKSKIGVVIHTKYKSNEDSVPVDKKTRSKFINHPDVHNVDPTLSVDPQNYTQENINEYLKHKNSADKLYKSMSPDSLDISTKYSDDLHKYINNEHQQGNELSIKSLINFLGDSFKKSIESSSTDKNKKEKTSKHTNKLNDTYKHDIHLDKTLQLHNSLMKAKNVLFHVMCKSIPWIHSLNGMPITPEGIVVIGKDGKLVKFVDRTIYKTSKNKKDS